MTDEQPFKRRSNGQFEQGGPGGPGRPRRQVEADYVRYLSDRVTPEVWAKVVDEAVEQAVLGDATARAWLSKYLCGDAGLRASLTQEELLLELLH
jgi:hypothetical protein